MAVYFLIDIYLEDFNFNKVSVFSLEALLSSLFLISIYLIDYHMISNKTGVIIIKFLIIVTLAIIFFKITSTYFQKYIGLWTLISLPVFFMIGDFIEREKNKPYGADLHLKSVNLR